MDENRYVVPITEVSPSFKEAKENYAKYGHGFVFHDAKPTPIADLAQGKRTVVVGEPGIGKTELMKKIRGALDESGHSTKFISLRSSESLKEVDAFVSKRSTKPKALLLDALDEVPRSVFSGVLKKIEEISEKHADIAIYVSSRWVFMDKYSNSFGAYRFVAIKPFTPDQIKEYLSSGTRPSADVDELFQHAMQFHGRVIIQIPRYLFLFEKYMEGKPAAAVQVISRNELFEHFIYSKLEIEANRNNDLKEMEPVIKRLLEKLALTMEIYQSNTITREDLITFFDDVKSDLKLMVLAQVGIDILLKNTVLQVSEESTDKLRFENAEFQEYLAAKEITRLSDPRRAAFEFASDPIMTEVYPSWYNTLSFLVDMDPDMLGQLLDFSGIGGETYKVADESFFNFLSRVNPSPTPPVVKKRLFKNVITYHNRRLQWMSGPITSAIPGFYSSDLEPFLKEEVESAEGGIRDEARHYVPLGNVAYAIAYLLRSGAEIDRPFWRARLVRYASEPCTNGVLPRHALLALVELKDPSVIDELPDLSDAPDELVIREFSSLCAEVAPNKNESVDTFIKLMRRNDLHGRYGLFEITGPEALKRFLRAYNNDERFRKEFLDDSSIFEDQDHKIVDNIRAVADAELKTLALEAIIKSVNYSVTQARGKSSFIGGLLSFLREEDPNFIPDLVRDIRASEGGETSLYFSQEFFRDLLSTEDIRPYIDAMLAAGMQPRTVMDTLTRIKWKGDEVSLATYEAGREKMPDTYREYEEAQNRPQVDHDQMYDERTLTEFKRAIEPEPGKYMNRVFHDYNSAADKLERLMSDEDREHFDTLIREQVLRHNPAERGLTINTETDGGASRNYTTSGAAINFGDALIAAQRRGIDITPYRANIARFIPFAHNDELKTVFELVPNFTREEIDPVVAIYSNRDTDLWRWEPAAFIKAAEQYSIVSAAPILRDFARETRFRGYERIDALSTSESLQPNPDFLRQLFAEYAGSESVDDQGVAAAANGLLITNYSDPNAINWRLEQLKGRVTESEELPRSGVVRDVSTFDREMNYGKEFAKPLMDLKQSGFEDTYLDLLNKALEVWSLGENYHRYAQYLWDIVYAYFDNLKAYGDYAPLRSLEKKLATVGSKQEGANWMAARMVQLRRSYLDAIGKPSRYAEAIRKYNVAREYDDKRIVTSADLAKHLQDALDTDLRQWIEGEGAYELILAGKVYDSKKQEYEKLIQKTITTQIKYAMLKRNIQVTILREPQLDDDKRVDMLIRYGFIGPLVLEVKLTSNSDIKVTKVNESKSYKSMERYMSGYGASHGIFLLIVNNDTKTVPRIKQAFDSIKGVTTISIDCNKFALSRKKPAKKAPKKAVKKTAKKTAKKKVTKKRSGRR